MGPVPVMLGAMLLLAPLGPAPAGRRRAGRDDPVGPMASRAGANELPPPAALTPASTSRLRSARRWLAAADGTVSLLIDYELGLRERSGAGPFPPSGRWTVLLAT